MILSFLHVAPPPACLMRSFLNAVGLSIASQLLVPWSDSAPLHITLLQVTRAGGSWRRAKAFVSNMNWILMRCKAFTVVWGSSTDHRCGPCYATSGFLLGQPFTTVTLSFRWAETMSCWFKPSTDVWLYFTIICYYMKCLQLADLLFVLDFNMPFIYSGDESTITSNLT